MEVPSAELIAEWNSKISDARNNCVREVIWTNVEWIAQYIEIMSVCGRYSDKCLMDSTIYRNNVCGRYSDKCLMDSTIYRNNVCVWEVFGQMSNG